MSKYKRNPFVISKALRNFLFAAVLTAAATQLAHTADSMLVGHFVGPDAVSAINLVLPFVEVLNCFGFLICFGANAMCARAIGCGDYDKVAKTFTSTLINIMTLGLLVSIGICVFSYQIVDTLSDEPRLDQMAYFMVINVWLIASTEGIELWWGFAVACIFVLILQLLITYLQSQMIFHDVSPVTLIPEQIKDYTFDRSVMYQDDDVYLALDEIDKFLKTATADKRAIFEVDLCLEELMSNIAKYSEGNVVQHSFDVHLCVNNTGIHATLKDAGKPFDPIKAGKMSDKNIGHKDYQHLGLRLVCNIIPDITYKYMYGQNTVFIHR